MDEKNSKSLWKKIGSFFHGMTGWMTAAAGLIVAVAGALTVLHIIPLPTASADGWAAKANKICAQLNEKIKDLPPPGSVGLKGQAGFIMSDDAYSREALRQLTALKVPPGEKEQVTKFIRLFAVMNGHLDTIADNYYVLANEPKSADMKTQITGQVTAIMNGLREISRLNKEFNQEAINLGATTCAEGSTPNIPSVGG